MKQITKFLAVGTVVAALAGCSGIGASVGGAIGNLFGSTPQIGGNATVQQACVAAEPSLTAAAKSTNPQATSIAAYGNAFCGPVLAGTMPPTTNSNSASWVLNLISELGPLLIPLLAVAMF